MNSGRKNAAGEAIEEFARHEGCASRVDTVFRRARRRDFSGPFASEYRAIVYKGKGIFFWKDTKPVRTSHQTNNGKRILCDALRRKVVTATQPRCASITIRL
jgi:hypothetical protein